MKVGKIRIRNFRNIGETEIQPGPRLNFFVGPNGQGKTSLLEALEYCSSLQSFRRARTFDLVREGTRGAEASCELVSEGERDLTKLKIEIHDLDVTSERAQRSVFLHDKRVGSVSKFYQMKQGFVPSGFTTVVFSPSNHDLVHGEPKERRAYLDQALSQERYEYMDRWKRYTKALEQRNASLREGRREGFREFTDVLIKEGAFLISARLDWWSRIRPFLSKISSELARVRVGSEPFGLDVEYLAALGSRKEPIRFDSLMNLSQEYWFKAYTGAAHERESAEWHAGVTLFGPHRDDWSLLLGGKELSRVGSQGEVRTSLLALKLAQVELTESINPGSTVFLLDDFSSELDPSRRKDLLDYLVQKNLQAFITTTEMQNGAGVTFHVRGGKFTEETTEESHV